jgi:hypothetical protein
MRKLAAAFALCFFAEFGLAAPNPTGGSGTPGHGNTYTITGTGFGTKVSPVDGSSKPYYYWDFEDGTQNNVTSLATGGVAALGDQNMTVTTENRGSSAKDLRSDAVNWAQFTPYGGVVEADFTAPAGSAVRSGKVYKYEKRKSSISSYTHDNSGTAQFENWKFDRFWVATNGSGYPNAYNAQNADSASTCSGGGQHPSPTVEAGSGSNYVKTSSAYRLPGSNWMAEERLLQYASANTIGDGLYRIRQDGQLNISRTDWKTDPSASFPAAGLRRWYTQDDPSNLGDCGGSTAAHDVWYDDIVFDWGDDSWARVMLGNASTLAACTTLEYQPASSWSSTSITIKQKFGELTSSTTKYIYVFDNTDTSNASGLLLQAGVGSPAPSITSILPSSGAYTGGTVVTVTGANFVTNCTIQFGTMTAITATFTNSTTISASSPFSGAATAVDIKVTNPDAQFAVLSSTFTYGPIPGIPIYRDRNPFTDDGNIYMTIH